MALENVKIIIKDSYLKVVKNSLGSNTWRNFYAKVNGQKKDITQNGELSCAFFVSSILIMFDLIKDSHLTVAGAIKDLKKSGWQSTRNTKAGCLLIWEATKSSDGHRHIGFCVSKDKAISTNYKTGKPCIHHLTFKHKRKIEAIFFNKKLK